MRRLESIFGYVSNYHPSVYKLIPPRPLSIFQSYRSSATSPTTWGARRCFISSKGCLQASLPLQVSETRVLCCLPLRVSAVCHRFAHRNSMWDWFSMTLIVENQQYEKITVQLSVKGKREWESCFEGVKGLERSCVLGERFNYILTSNKFFYNNNRSKRERHH